MKLPFTTPCRLLPAHLNFEQGAALERSEAVERLESLERTGPHDERSEAIERFERLERVFL
jgi:hypothetical protein